MLVYHSLERDSIKWNEIFSQQVGGEAQKYVGLYGQRGHGVFGRLWKILVPVMKSLGSSVSTEALKTAAGTLSDVVDGDTVQNAAKRNIKRGVNRLLEKGAKATKTESFSGNGRKGGRKRKIAIVRQGPPKKRSYNVKNRI